MKKVLINAITIKMGGGVVVLKCLFNELQKRHDIQWVLVVDEQVSTQFSPSSHITILTFPEINKSPWSFIYWHEFVLPALIKKMKIDLVFSQINVLPLHKLGCSTLLLIHHAGYFSKEYQQLLFLHDKRWLAHLAWKARCYWVYFSAKRAKMVTVQTQALADAIINKIACSPKKIKVIPHGPGLADNQPQTAKEFSEKILWRIGYITKLGVQKNFETLLEALKRLKYQGNTFLLIVTLDVKDAMYKKFMCLVMNYGLEDCIINYGDLGHAEVRELYQSLDFFVYPSLCESFGFTLLEAMYYGLPIIAANTESNHEILQSSTGLFSAKDGNALANKMLQLMNDPGFYTQLAEHSLKRSQDFSWANAAQEVLKIIDSIVNQEKVIEAHK